MQKLNCVFVFDGATSGGFVDFAQEHFSDKADGYCLADNIYPHITVAQFSCGDEGVLQDVMYEIDSLSYEGIHFHFNDFVIRDGDGKHTGYQWAEFPVTKNEELESFHRQVVGILRKYGVEPTSKVDDEYHPHITICRIPEGVSPASVEGAENISGCYQGDVCLITGHSDENGQLLSLGS